MIWIVCFEGMIWTHRLACETYITRTGRTALLQLIGFGRRFNGDIFRYGRGPHRFADALALALHAVHQPASPDKFRGKQAQAKKYHQPSWPGRNNHHYPCEQQSKASNDAEGAADLLDSADDHGIPSKSGRIMAERVGYSPSRFCYPTIF